MKFNRLAFIIWIFIFITACDAMPITNSSRSIAGGQSEGITLIYPYDGQHLSLGEMVDVQSQVSNAASTLSVALLVNDTTYRKDDFTEPFTTADVYQPWTPAMPGIYTLQTILDHGGIVSSIITVFVDQVSEEGSPLEQEEEIAEEIEEKCPVPIATTNGYANCRSGPGTAYEIVEGLKLNQSFPIVGKSISGTWWQVERNTSGGTCWIWENLIDICGNSDDVEVVGMQEKDEVVEGEVIEEEAPVEPEGETDNGESPAPPKDPGSGPTTPG